MLAGILLAGCSTGDPDGSRRGPPERGASRPPSILLVTIDTLRADHLRAYGYERETAPFISSLAASGTVFDDAQSTSSWTVPAMASVATGLYPASHGAQGSVVKNAEILEQEVLSDELPSLPETLRELGYRTYAIFANGHLDAPYGYARGFDGFACFGFARASAITRQGLAGRDAFATGKGPFFLWLHYFDPHHPYNAREPWFREFVPDATDEELALVKATYATWPEVPVELLERRERMLEVLRALYDSEIRYADAHLAALYEAIPELADCYTVIASDHGEELLDHGRMGHGLNLHGETVRVPLIVRRPGGAGGGTRSARLVSLVDVAPTLIEVAGGEVPAAMSGRSLERALEPSEGSPRRVLAHLERGAGEPTYLSLIEPRWKLIVRRTPTRAELYDRSADPTEQRDLAPERQEDVDRLARSLAGLLSSLPAAPAVERAGAVSAEREEQLRALGYVD